MTGSITTCVVADGTLGVAIPFKSVNQVGSDMVSIGIVIIVLSATVLNETVAIEVVVVVLSLVVKGVVIVRSGFVNEDEADVVVVVVITFDGII